MIVQSQLNSLYFQVVILSILVDLFGCRASATWAQSKAHHVQDNGTFVAVLR